MLRAGHRIKRRVGIAILISRALPKIMNEIDDKERRKRRLRNSRQHKLRSLSKKPKKTVRPSLEEDSEDEIVQYLVEKNLEEENDLEDDPQD